MSCGGTGDRWDAPRNDWGVGKCVTCRGRGSNLFAVGQRVEFRESAQGPIESGTVSEILPPDDSHPNGGEYLIGLTAGGEVVAWFDELTAL